MMRCDGETWWGRLACWPHGAYIWEFIGWAMPDGEYRFGKL